MLVWSCVTAGRAQLLVTLSDYRRVDLVSPLDDCGTFLSYFYNHIYITINHAVLRVLDALREYRSWDVKPALVATDMWLDDDRLESKVCSKC